MATAKKLEQPQRVRGSEKSGLPTRERNRVIQQAKIKPLDVMMSALADSWALAESMEDPEAKLKAQQAAVAVAEKVAPYLHPKLQATTLKGDPNAPLSFAMSLPDSSVLLAAVRGKLAK